MLMNNDKVKAIRKMYPKGTRIMLEHMEDSYHPVESGMTGTVRFVDDAGTIHMMWDNGSSLGICSDTDRFHVIEKEAE